jgi:ribonuclease E
MASHDQSRSEPVRDDSRTPSLPDATAAPADDAPAPAAPGDSERVVSPSRPRGAASFPGGAPPASSTSAPSVPAQPAPLDAGQPQFQVTTVETTAAASFPGGPPPPSRRGRRAAATPDGEVPTSRASAGAQVGAEPATEARPPTGQAAEGASAEAASGRAPARRGRSRGRGGARTESAASDTGAGSAVAQLASEATSPSAAVAAVVAAAAAAVTEPATGADEAQAGQAGGARAGRGTRAGRGRPRAARGPSTRAASAEAAAADAVGVPPAAVDEAVPATPASGPAVAPVSGEVAEEAAATEPGGEEPARTGRRRRRRRSAQARTAAPQPEAEQGTAAAPEAAAASSAAAPDLVGEDTAPADDQSAGSARTRARRRRRAAAKARTRTDEDATDVAAPAAEARQAEAAQPAAPAPPEQPARQSGRGGRRRGGQAAEPAAAAEPPSRGRGRGRGRSAAASQVEQPAAAATQVEPAGRGGAERSASDRSTRLDARGRGGTRQSDHGRRRRPQGLTEEQKQVLRAGPDKRMLVTEGADRTQIGVIEGNALVEHYVTRKSGRSYVGNIYLGRVQNVLPGMEAAFVDIGKGRNAVLYAGEVNYDEEDLDGEAPRIEKVLKPGQPVLVQVTKDPIGSKGARLTAQVSLAGRYLVLQPDDSTFGISRRLPEAERVRLREILKEVRPKGLGLIVRTAAEGASADDLRADLARLQARWETVERKAKKSSAPAVIYSEPELVVRVIRDIFSPDFVELVVDGVELHERVRDYLDEVAPDQLAKLRRHEGRLPLFEHYRVVEQIHKALERKVWLPSGGSIVIDRTEAMTVVDVNTGKFVGKSNLEETVVANNLEAADELVRQLRLRDIGGIIIIDFIDMLFERNQQAVVERLRSALARDKTKSQVMEVSSLGLVQMTRKRVSGGLLDSFSETCPHCEGRGVVITHEI